MPDKFNYDRCAECKKDTHLKNSKCAPCNKVKVANDKAVESLMNLFGMKK